VGSSGCFTRSTLKITSQPITSCAALIDAWISAICAIISPIFIAQSGAQRDLVPEGSAISRALDYSLKRWSALSRYLDDGAVPIDNNWAENQIRPWALGRKNWLFAGSLRSGKRAAAIMSLIQSARLNGHDPYAYLKDVLTRLPTQRASEIDQLLPHNWQPVWLRGA